MNKIKILISLYFMCFINIAKAQTNPQNKKPINASTSGVVSKFDSMITLEVRADLQKVAAALDSSILKKEVKNETVKITLDKEVQTLSVSIDTTNVKLSDIRKRLNANGFLLLEKKAVKSPIEVVEVAPPKIVTPIEKENYNPDIDKFLNLEDTTIFTTNFKIYALEKIHPSRRAYYQVVQIIHNFGGRLKEIENSLSKSKIQKVAASLEISEEAAERSLSEAAKKNMDKAKKDFEALLPFDKEIEILFPSQKQYYKALMDKFNELYSKINPN